MNDVQVYDAGIPEKSAEAVVIVNIVNVNDQSPVFDQQMYSAAVQVKLRICTRWIFANFLLHI